MPAELTTLRREDRVLTLLHLLGDEVAEQFLGTLDTPTAQSLRGRLKNWSAQLPSPRKQTEVLDEFERFFEFTIASAPRLTLHQPEEDDEPVEVEAAFVSSGDPLVDLEKMNRFQLAGALQQEQPRMVAILLKCLSPKRVAEILNLLESAHREEVVREFSLDPRAPEIILRRIAASTVDRARSLPATPPEASDPISRLVEVLRATEKPQRRQILKTIEEQDSEKAALIGRSLYQFDDLVTLDDHQIQKVLARVDSTSLSTALFGASDTILAKIMNNLSKRARATLQEEMSFRKNVPAASLTAARELVVQAIAEADQE